MLHKFYSYINSHFALKIIIIINEFLLKEKMLIQCTTCSIKYILCN